jgi:hypothetical protein
MCSTMYYRKEKPPASQMVALAESMCWKLEIECGDFFILGEAERVMEVREGWRVLFRAEHCFRKSQVREWVWDPKAGSRHPKEGVSSG